MELPRHLARYCVDQDYSRYTPIDQAVWRHIMRQLKSFLSVHAHPVYLEGLKKTGIEVDRIPSIDAMSEKLQTFGWSAVPVSGFIPPAAFMELQALGVLPIASDMRTVEHLLYTPAPDIVHEAAGHAPILVDPDFAAYLKSYAKVASKAIISKKDIDQYEAIRVLSDLKEDPSSSQQQIEAAEARLSELRGAPGELSEAALLGRMNWWTAEYGLIGNLKAPKIFGAGLLSSVGEARACLEPKVKKLPLSIECIQYGYDITEQQPQLFVVPEFGRLGEVLAELAQMMAFRRGGLESLEKIVRAETVNTVELDSGLQLSGKLKEFIVDRESPAYLVFDGPTQLCLSGYEIHGQGTRHHSHGFGSPVGAFSISRTVDGTPVEIENLAGADVSLRFESGVSVVGRVYRLLRNHKRDVALISFSQAKATYRNRVLFDPSWGEYDMAVGRSVVSVFGGPADREAYGEVDDFTRTLVPMRRYSAAQIKQHDLYRRIAAVSKPSHIGDVSDSHDLYTLCNEVTRGEATDNWLAVCELLEQVENRGLADLAERLRDGLGRLAQRNPVTASHIRDALQTLHLK